MPESAGARAQRESVALAHHAQILAEFRRENAVFATEFKSRESRIIAASAALRTEMTHGDHRERSAR